MKPRILIVEDEPYYAANLMQQLRELDYDPAAIAPSGEDALEIAARDQFDLALTDLRLDGDLDGIETSRLLREKFSLESVLMTGLTDRKLIERALTATPYGFLSKPFRPDALKLSVEMALQRLRAETALRERDVQLSTVLKTSMDGFWTIALDGRILDINDAACQMTGYSRDELLTMNLVQLEHGRTPEQIAAGIELVVQHGSVQIERLARRKDGQVRLIDMSVTCSPAPNRRLYCFGRDITDRRQAENAVHEREHRLRAIIDTIPYAVWLKDLEGRYLAVNRLWCHTYNKNPELVLGKTDFDFFPKEAATTYWERDEHVRKKLTTLTAEVEHTTANGKTIWLDVRKAPVLDKDGRCVGLVGITLDITARRDAHNRLVLLHSAVEQSPVAIIITDTIGQIQYVNPYFERQTGYALEEAIGKNPRILNSGIHPKEFFKDLWTTILGGREWHGEMRNRRKNGDLYWEHASISPVRDEQGNISNFVAVKEDITRRKNTEFTMAWQSALVENSVDICCIKDLNLRVLSANMAMARTAGVSHPGKLVGKTDAEIFKSKASDAETRAYMEDELAVQKLPPGQVLVREEKLHSADGSEGVLLTRKFPVYDHDGKLIATANISTDITEEKRAEHELIRARDEAEAANKAKSTFLATMSHELRTPLNVINGMASILTQSSWPPEQQHAIEMISEGGNTLLTIIEEILDYSGLQAGKTKLELAPFSLLAIASNALRLFETTARSKGIKVSCSFDPTTPAEAIGDSRRLQQVLVNLLQNAVKFTEGGRIHLRLQILSQNDDHFTVRLSVRDTGIGINPENLNNLFQPFTQADGTITRRFGGTGLGLAISKSFIQLMGGEINAVSRPGRGSEFSFTVKLGATANHTTAFDALCHPGFAKRRILLANQHGAQQRTLLALLRAWKMQPVLADPRLQPAATPKCDAAILPAPQAITNPPDIPVVWQGRPDPSAKQDQPFRSTADTLDATQLATALAELLFPTPETAAQTPDAPSSQPPVPLPITILAAEDNRTNREVIKLVLRHIGYSVDLVENGAEAVEAVRKKHYDLVLMDVQMPVMDGLTASTEICRNLPDRSRRPLIVALTANALPGDRERCIAAGMDDYLTKPILPADLLVCIHRNFKKGTPTHASELPKTSKPDPNAIAPLIDTIHLATITAGLDPAQVVETLSQLHANVCSDFLDTLPRIDEACAIREQKHFAETVHGLKGCFMMTGWNRAGKYCAQAIASARQGRFQDWETFPSALRDLYAFSNQAMTAHLSALLIRNEECRMKN